VISLDYQIHLTSKSNSRGHWIRAAREAKSQRKTVLTLVDLELLRWMAPGRWPYQLKRETYKGRFRGASAVKTKFTRVLDPIWQARLNAGITVTLTRQAERALDDDNLRDAFKSIRDGVADSFGIRDDDKRVSFAYAQRQGTPSKINVRIEWIEEAHATATPTA
jgi:hypothetical protein